MLSFISGNFQIIHSGHHRLFKFARQFSDKLIVGVYLDAQNFDDKNSLDNIIKILKNNEYIDEVLIINNNLLKVLSQIKPNFIIKGYEHSNKKNIEDKYISIKQNNCKLVFSSGINENLEDNIITKFNTPINHDRQFIDKNNVDKNKLNKIINNFQKLKVCVIGEIIEDVYEDFSVLGLSQEDPTVVLSSIGSSSYVGGAGIVASHSSSLGAKTSLISIYNKDENSSIDTKLFDNNVETILFNDETRKNIKKKRLRSAGKTLLRINEINSHFINKKIEKKIIDYFKSHSKNFDVLIFSDFNYGLLPKSLISKLIKIANDNNIFISVDSQISSQFGDITRYKDIDLLSLTEHEVRETINNNYDGLIEIMSKLQKKINTNYFNLKLGASGSIIFDYIKRHSENLNSLNKSPLDVSGAGDSMLVATTLSLAAKSDPTNAAYLGALSAALQVSKKGNVPIDIKSLRNAVNQI